MATASQGIAEDAQDPRQDPQGDRIFQFTIVLADHPVNPEEVIPRLSDAGYPDIIFLEGEGATGPVHFIGMARTLGDAVYRAIRAVEKAGYTVDRVVIDR
jgi:hypothetical protein